MAKVKISEFSATAANNTDIDGININEGCAPSGINDAIRELMAQLKDFQTGAVGDSFNGPIGTSTAAAGAFTTLSATGAITSTLATGTAPLVIASTTKVANLNVDLLDGADWAAPAALGSTTPAAVSATTLSASSTVTLSGGTANGVAYLNGSKVVTSGSALTFDGTNLGVGTTTTNAKLTVKQDAADGLFIKSADSNYSSLSLGIAVSSGITYLQSTNSGTGGQLPFAFYIGGSEQMRLTSTGLGIGTSSPTQKLSVDQTLNGSVWAKISNGSNTSGAAAGVLFGSNAGDLGAISLLSSSNSPADALFLRSLSTNPLVFGTNNTERMRLDSSGNLGLGVTPSAWGATAFQVLRAALWGVSNSAYLSANTRFDGSSRYYIATDSATEYRQTAGQHSWLTAPSGTAGNAITFTQAMTLTADGALAIGTTSPTAKLHVSNGGAAGLEFSPISGYLGGGYIQGYNRSTSAFIPVEVIAESFGVVLGSSRALTVDSSGNLLVGTTSQLGSNLVSLVKSTGDMLGMRNSNATAGLFWNHIVGSDNKLYIVNASTTGVSIANGDTSWGAFSDERSKDIIEPITDATNKVSTLRSVIGKYKTDSEGTRRSFLIAQDVQAVLPEAVDASNPDELSLRYSEVIPLLVAAIKEQNTIIESLKARLDAANL